MATVTKKLRNEPLWHPDLGAMHSCLSFNVLSLPLLHTFLQNGGYVNLDLTFTPAP